jgi:site-specific DNA-methyltransferase (cytosine-N4-specific)
VTFDKAFALRRYRLLAGREWELALPHLPYLRSWFRESVLVQLSAILQEISALPSTDVQLILKVVLSDILRNVSMQDPGDLRMRRLANPPENAPAVPLFLSSALSKVDQVLRARAYLQTGQGNHTVLLGDARRCAKPAQGIAQRHRFAAALTSPPYATALPYIDTQRLSLVLFDHVRNDELHTQERRMIGSREILTREREAIDQRMAGSNKGLPQECSAFCRTLRSALSNDTDGFRRRNAPALLYKYLTDMADMFREVHQLIEPGTPYALVVGQNKTTLSGRTYMINTPYLLTCVAEDNGFELQESVELETYQRYDIHQSNSIRTETLLILQPRGNAC